MKKDVLNIFQCLDKLGNEGYIEKINNLSDEELILIQRKYCSKTNIKNRDKIIQNILRTTEDIMNMGKSFAEEEHNEFLRLI